MITLQVAIGIILGVIGCHVVQGLCAWFAQRDVDRRHSIGNYDRPSLIFMILAHIGMCSL